MISNMICPLYFNRVGQ